MVLVSIRIMGVITCYNPTLVTEGHVILDQNGVSKLSKNGFPKNHKQVVRFKPSLNKPIEFVAVTCCYHLLPLFMLGYSWWVYRKCVVGLTFFQIIINMNKATKSSELQVNLSHKAEGLTNKGRICLSTAGGYSRYSWLVVLTPEESWSIPDNPRYQHRDLVLCDQQNSFAPWLANRLRARCRESCWPPWRMWLGIGSSQLEKSPTLKPPTRLRDAMGILL